MAVTKRSFQGGREAIRDYPDPGSNIQDLMVNMAGAVAMQSSISKGGDNAMVGPGHDAIDPRRLFSVHIGNARLGVIPSGSELHHNQASTGRHQPEKELITGAKAPRSTGAGEGREHVHMYKPVIQGSSTRLDRQKRRPGGLLGGNTRS